MFRKIKDITEEHIGERFKLEGIARGFTIVHEDRANNWMAYSFFLEDTENKDLIYVQGKSNKIHLSFVESMLKTSSESEKSIVIEGKPTLVNKMYKIGDVPGVGFVITSDGLGFLDKPRYAF